MKSKLTLATALTGSMLVTILAWCSAQAASAD
jgi:hypothetical protein